MKPFRPTMLPLVIAGLALVATGCGADAGIPDGALVVATLDGSAPGHAWFRGNLHAHTLWSDGDAYPEQVAGWYREHGYQFLAITDHDQVLSGERWIDVARSRGGTRALEAMHREHPGAVATRSTDGRTEARLATHEELARRFDAPGRFLVLRADELSDSVVSTSIHLTALNVDAAPAPRRVASVATAVEAHLADLARTPAAVGVLNHPNFSWSVTAEQVLRMESLRLFELYNGHPLSNNAGNAMHASTERVWDIVLAHRASRPGQPLLYGTAADDAHQFLAGPRAASSPGRGWVMVPGARLSPDVLADALRRGRFYASTGVSLARVVEYDRGLRVEVAAEPGVDYTIEFIGTRRGTDMRGRPARSRGGRPVYATRRYPAGIGQVLARVRGTSGEYAFHPDDLYVRARVSASRRHPNPSQAGQFEQAWVQPVLGPAGRAARPGSSPAYPPPAPVALHPGLAPSFEPVAAVPPAAGPGSTVDCSVDRVADAGGVPNLVLSSDQGLLLSGWIADRGRPGLPASVGVRLRGDAHYLGEGGNGVARPDVAAHLGNPSLEGAGFNLLLPLRGVRPGTYAIGLVAYYASGALECTPGVRIMVRPPPTRPTGG